MTATLCPCGSGLEREFCCGARRPRRTYKPPLPTATGRRVKFGWCLDGHHDDCRFSTPSSTPHVPHSTCTCLQCHPENRNPGPPCPLCNVPLPATEICSVCAWSAAPC